MDGAKGRVLTPTGGVLDVAAIVDRGYWSPQSACSHVVRGGKLEERSIDCPGTIPSVSAGTPTTETGPAAVDLEERADPSFRRRWLVLFIALVPLAVTWSTVNPMLASPDEPFHILRAQSIAAGDFSNPFTSDGLPMEAVECLKFQPEATADCQDLTWGRDGTEQIGPTEGYPPLYHAIAAIPALFVSGLSGAYLMRIWMAVVITVLLAWAGALVTRPGAGPWPLTGVTIAITPMAIFTVATVNPSGLAVASSVLVVVGAISLLESRWRGREVVAATAIGAVGLALSRRDGLLWLGLLMVVLAPLWAPQVRRRWARRSTRSTWTVIGVASALAVVALVWARPTIARFARNWQDGEGTSWWEAARFIRGYLGQVVGVFGWLDSPIGDEVLWVALVVVGFVVLLGLVSDDRRLALATLLGVVGLLASPIVFGMIRFPYLQGRYLLPIWIGGTVLAGAAAAAGDTGVRFDRRAARLVLAIWATIHLIAGIQNLRRYAVGRSGSWNFIFDSQWHPPTMPNVLAVFLYIVSIVAAAAGMLIVLRLSEAQRSDELLRRSSDLFGQATRHPVEDAPPDQQADH